MDVAREKQFVASRYGAISRPALNRRCSRAYEWRHVELDISAPCSMPCAVTARAPSSSTSGALMVTQKNTEFLRDCADA